MSREAVRDDQTPVEIGLLMHIEQPERETGQPGFPVLEDEGGSRRLIDKQEIRQVAVEFQPAQTVFGGDPRDYNHAQQHGEQEVEEIVAGIERRDADRQGKEEEVNAF